MTLEELGYSDELEKYRIENHLDSFDFGRVIVEHKDRYRVATTESEFEAEIIGSLRYNAINRSDLPAVGDWVSMSSYDENKALIHAVFPRKSIVKRKAVGKLGQTQIIAANIDYGLIVQSINRDFNINRLERYITICYDSKIKPIIILTKIDLLTDKEVELLINQVKERIQDVPLFAISNYSKIGIDQLKASLHSGKTYCLLGSSGVGKSSLINIMADKNIMDTGAISEAIDRGKHVTSHRELIVTPYGILIDNPGMREIGITNISDGLASTFDEILILTDDCKFKDCTHTKEKSCAVLKAIENDELDEDAYHNFMKMEKERSHFEMNAQERKRKDRDFGKMIKNVKKHRKENKF